MLTIKNINFEKKKIPTLFGLVALLIITVITTFSISGAKSIISKAGSSGEPKIDEKSFITNITSTSFTVNWTTDKAVIGSISYGATPNLGLFVSEKNANNSHSLKVSSGLVKNTKYYFKIISGEKTYEVTTLEKDPEINPSTASPKKSRFPSIDINNQIQDELPTFKGSGEPGTLMQIKVESPETFTDTVRVNADGSWSWTPPSNLTPGDHKVTLTLVDEEGKIQTIVKEFTVIAGSPLLPITSGSVSATPTSSLPLPTSVPSPTSHIPLPTSIVTPTTGPLDFLPLFFLGGGLLMILSFILL